MANQITKVRKDGNGDITELYSGTWESINTVILYIKLRSKAYFTSVNGSRADVVVVPATATRKEHLRSTPDGTTRNNLDYLPVEP